MFLSNNFIAILEEVNREDTDKSKVKNIIFFILILRKVFNNN